MAGSSRFLNTIYATDLTVSGETSFAGITASSLTVSGNATINGTTALKGTSITGTLNIINATSANADTIGLVVGGNNTGKRTRIMTDTIQTMSNTSTSSLWLNYWGGTVYLSNGNQISANNGTFTTPTLTATTATIGTANITTGKAADFEITGTLRTYEHDIDHVANLGGNFLVTPTINFLDGTVSITSLTKSGNVITVTIKDATTLGNTAGVTSIGNVDWLRNAKIKICGEIGGVVLGTCDGKLEADLNATAGTMTVSFTYTGNRLADIPTAGTAITDIKGLTVMLTETVATSGASTSHKIGIYMTARDSNNYSHISMYNGVSDDPTVRIGNLSGLDPVNGFDPDDLDDRWGIYTSNGFFKGVIISEEGKIGGWFLGSDAIYSSSKTFGAANNMYFGASGISLGTTFKVTNAGALTSTSGNIAAFQIDATALHTANVAITSNADNSIALSHADFTRTVAGASRTGLRFAIGDKFGVTGDGVLYGSNVNLTGAINATSGTIGSNATSGNRWQIGDKAIYNTTNSMTSTGVGTYVGVDGIRNYKDANTYVNIQNGVITAKAVNLTGAITATSLTLSQGVTIGQDKIDGLTDDLNDAAKTATNYLTFEPAHGLMIANQSDAIKTITTEGGKNVLIDNDSVDIRNGQTVMASFGEHVIIGESDNSKLTLTPVEMVFKKPDNTEVFKVTTGEEYYIQTEYEQVSRPTGTVSHIAIDDNIVNIGIVVDGTVLSNENWYQQGNTIYFTPPIEGASTITIHGDEQETQIVALDSPSVTVGQVDKAHSVIDADGQRFYAKDGTTLLANIGYAMNSSGYDRPYYIFGSDYQQIWTYDEEFTYTYGDIVRYNDKLYVCISESCTGVTPSYTNANWTYPHGDYSILYGRYCVSVGAQSLAGGRACVAVGQCSVAIGNACITWDRANNSHASGSESEARYRRSFAHGYGVIANRDSQTVIGEYNAINQDDGRVNTRGNHALIIGNGTDDENRSDAFRFDWNGDMIMYLDVDSAADASTAATSGTDMDLFNAIRALGWYDDVIS